MAAIFACTGRRAVSAYRRGGFDVSRPSAETQGIREACPEGVVPVRAHNVVSPTETIPNAIVNFRTHGVFLDLRLLAGIM